MGSLKSNLQKMDPIINNCYATVKVRSRFSQDDLERLISFLESEIKFGILTDEKRNYWKESCNLIQTKRCFHFRDVPELNIAIADVIEGIQFMRSYEYLETIETCSTITKDSSFREAFSEKSSSSDISISKLSCKEYYDMIDDHSL